MFAIDNVGSQLRRAETLGRHGRHPDHAMSGTLSTQFHAYLRARHPQAAGEGGAAGETQVYKLSKLPGIGWKHFLALFQILRETRTPYPTA